MKKISSKLPDYKNFPLIEVAMAIQFDDLHGFPAPYLGNLWDAFDRKEFPYAENHPVAAPMSAGGVTRIIFTDPSQDIPRVWFLNKDKTELIQFQHNRLVFNWRKTDEKPNAPYPRYEAVAKKFMEKLRALNKFAEAQLSRKLTYSAMELTYINSIPFESFGGPPRIGSCLKDVVWQEKRSFLPEPSKYRGIWEFDLPELNGQMLANTYSIQQMTDGKPILRLDITVRGQYASPFDKDDSNMLKWYDSAHEHIVLGFDDLTTPEMHQRWGKHDRK